MSYLSIVDIFSQHNYFVLILTFYTYISLFFHLRVKETFHFFYKTFCNPFKNEFSKYSLIKLKTNLSNVKESWALSNVILGIYFLGIKIGTFWKETKINIDNRKKQRTKQMNTKDNRLKPPSRWIPSSVECWGREGLQKPIENKMLWEFNNEVISLRESTVLCGIQTTGSI